MDVTVFEAIRNQGLRKGMAVMSKQGHDRGRLYLVMDIQANFVYLSDGIYRSVMKPKKKRASHVKPLGIAADAGTIDKILDIDNNALADSRIRKITKEFTARQITKAKEG